MLNFSQLEFFANIEPGEQDPALDRRTILKASLASPLLPLGLLNRRRSQRQGQTQELEIPDDPLGIVRAKRLPTLIAMINAQVNVLWCGSNLPRDNACEIAEDILTYMSYLPKRLQHGSNMALLWLDAYSVKHTGRRLHKLSTGRIRQLLNQGETQQRSRMSPPQTLWENDHLLHLAASGVFMLGRMVIFSRQPARELIGFSWSKPCEKPENLVSVDRPPVANLCQKFDVCILGSGAGGATMAQRLTAAGKRVLIIDTGDFVGPDALIRRIPLKSGLDLALPHRRKKIDPKQSVNVVQARVFGGGPYVNNAIHLPISEAVYNEKWAGRQPAGLPYADFAQMMSSIKDELGVNTSVTKKQISDRSLRFREGAENLGQTVHPLPVAIRESSQGCGSDNSVDSFGDHVGGIHPYRPQ